MSASLCIPAPAKLNLFLHINGRLANGYHQLQTVFQLLDYGDSLTLTATDAAQIRIEPALQDVPEQQNLVYRAATLLQNRYQVKRGVTIGIDKQLPMGGGLGGGSSNAASTLLGLNQLWDLGLSLTELAALGLELGADVPVFVRGENSFAEGVGEQLYPLSLPQRWYIVVKPPINVSTAAIFAHPQLTRDTLPIRIAAFFEAGGETVSLEQVLSRSGYRADSLKNDCEQLIRQKYPAIDQALNWLGQHATPALTGTGSCIFASFDSEAAARTVLDSMPLGLTGFVSRASNRSLAHIALGI